MRLRPPRTRRSWLAHHDPAGIVHAALTIWAATFLLGILVGSTMVVLLAYL